MKVIFCKTGKTLREILLDEVLYFEVLKEYVRLINCTEKLLIYRRLNDIQEQLSSPFVRVHNSYIVNTKLLSKMQDNHIYIADKQVPVSEKLKDDFVIVIKERIFLKNNPKKVCHFHILIAFKEFFNLFKDFSLLDENSIIEQI